MIGTRARRGVAVAPHQQQVALQAASLLLGYPDEELRGQLPLLAASATLAFPSVAWARPRGVGKWTPAPAKLSDVLRPGQLVRAPAPVVMAVGRAPTSVAVSA